MRVPSVKSVKSMEELLYRHPVFTFEMAQEHLGGLGENPTTKRLLRIQRKGRIVRVLRGVYAAVSPGVDPALFQPDPFLVLRALRPDSVFCGHSALDLQGVSNQVWNRVTAYSTGKAVTYKTRHAVFSLIKCPSWITPDATTTIDRKAVFLRLTCPELTLIEGFRYPARVGGIEELVKSADAFRYLDVQKLLKLLDRFKMRKLDAAIGWYLSRSESLWTISGEDLAALQAHRPTSPRYLESGSEGAVMDSRWNLMIPREVAMKENRNIEF